jgi:hypothetical protein
MNWKGMKVGLEGSDAAGIWLGREGWIREAVRSR